MSIRIMTLAWEVELKPSAKLVLMALADIANDEGICWPSARLVARKCCITDRAVRSILGDLELAELVRIENRFRPDGSQASNRYVVFPDLDGGEQSARGVVAPSGEDERPNVGGSEAKLIPLNHQPDTPITTTRDEGSVGIPKLVFPKELNPPEQQEAERKVQGLSREIAQDILFELAGRMKVSHVRDPLRYLSALITKAKSGSFKADLASRAKEAHRRSEVVAASAETADQAPLGPVPRIAVDGLPPRLREILSKHVRIAAPSDTAIEKPEE